MSEIVLYQSILQKLGQLSPKDLAELDAFLAFLVQRETKSRQVQNPNQALNELFGAWKDWEEEEFQSFLEHTKEVRSDLFTTREIEL
jgi:hypothetical protein